MLSKHIGFLDRFDKKKKYLYRCCCKFVFLKDHETVFTLEKSVLGYFYFDLFDWARTTDGVATTIYIFQSEFAEIEEKSQKL